jgi:hypothetical protein
LHEGFQDSGALALGLGLALVGRRSGLVVLLEIGHVFVVAAFFVVLVGALGSHAFHARHAAGAATQLGEVDAAEPAVLAHAASAELVQVVILWSLVLLVLVDPLESPTLALGCHFRWTVTNLVEIGAQPMDLGLVFEQARPVFFLEFLLAQDHLDVGGGVVGFGVVDIDLGEEVNVQSIGGLLGF